MLNNLSRDFFAGLFGHLRGSLPRPGERPSVANVCGWKEKLNPQVFLFFNLAMSKRFRNDLYLGESLLDLFPAELKLLVWLLQFLNLRKRRETVGHHEFQTAAEDVAGRKRKESNNYPAAISQRVRPLVFEEFCIIVFFLSYLFVQGFGLQNFTLQERERENLSCP